MDMKTTLLHQSRHEFSFSKLIPQRLINDLCADTQRFRIFDPASTLFCFLYQVLADCSAKETLLNFNLRRAHQGLKAVSMNTSSYVRAKARLSEEKVKSMARNLGLGLQVNIQDQLFKGREVLLGDGTTLNLEDTDQIKKVFPPTMRLGRQQSAPKMRCLFLFNALTGCFIDGAVGSYSGKGQGEMSLLKRLLDRLRPETILVLDRFFMGTNFRKILSDQSLDYVIRTKDSVAKKRLGSSCDVVVIESNGQRVRYIKSTKEQRGFRSSTYYFVTTLFEKNGFSKKDIELLYARRWGVETDIRHLKQTLKASGLRSQTSAMAMIELWVHMIAFNLVRATSIENCRSNGEMPRQQCFKVYVKALSRVFSGVKDEEGLLLRLLKSEILVQRHRSEPRAIKWQAQRYEPMKMPREQARKLSWGKSGRQNRRASRELKVSNSSVL